MGVAERVEWAEAELGVEEFPEVVRGELPVGVGAEAPEGAEVGPLAPPAAVILETAPVRVQVAPVEEPILEIILDTIPLAPTLIA